MSLFVRCDGPACPAESPRFMGRGYEIPPGWTHLDDDGPAEPGGGYPHHEHDFCSRSCLRKFLAAHYLAGHEPGTP